MDKTLMSVLSICVLMLSSWCDLSQGDMPPRVPFSVTRVEKTETADAYHMKVMYEGPRTTALFMGEDSLQPLQQHEMGVAEFIIPKQEGYSKTWVNFPDQFLTLYLNPVDTPDYIDVPRVQFTTSQGSDIAFQHGQDVHMDFSSDINGDIDNIEHDRMMYHIMLKSDTEDNVITRYSQHHAEDNSRPVPVNLVPLQFGGPKGHRFVNFVLNSTIEDVEGVVEASLAVEFNCSKNCLVLYLHSFLTVEFHRVDHEGPFPKDFIGFVHDQDMDHSVHYCAVDHGKCHISCSAFGDGLTKLEIAKINSLDQNQLKSNLNRNFGVSWLFFPDVSLGDAGTYQCTAETANKRITEQRELRVIQAPTIDQQLSKKTTFENGSLLFTCVANGIPAPNVTLAFYNDPLEAIPEPHVTHPSQSETRVDVFVSDPDILSSSEFSCHATNVDQQFSGQYYFNAFEVFAAQN